MSSFRLLRIWCKRTRLRGALAMAALYAVCVLAPHAALAFGGGEHAAHCLTGSDKGVAEHVHADGTSHMQSDGTAHAQHESNAAKQDTHDNGKLHSASSCCGLFSMTALDNAVDTSLAVLPQAAAHYLILTATLWGGRPDCLYRPPNV